MTIVVRGEKVHKRLLISPEGERRLGAGRERYRGVITEVRVDHPPLHVELPAAVHGTLDRLASWLSGGRGLTREATALGALATYLWMAVLLALVSQRLAGFR